VLPDIDSLALFVQAAEHGSLTKAAEACNIGVAGASRRIMLLEARLKATLFDRSPRGMLLTPAGEGLLVRAKTVLAQVNDIQLTMKEFAAGRQGALRLLVSSSTILDAFPADIAEFSRQNREIEVTVEERGSVEIARAVREFEADLGVIVDGTPADGLATFTYRTDHLAVLAPPGHQVAEMAHPSFEQLLDHELITLENGSSITRLLSERASMVGRVLRPTVQVRGFEAVCRLVHAGLGVGVLPLGVARLLVAGRGVVVRPLQDDWAERKILVAVRAEQSGNMALSKLVSHLSRKHRGVAAETVSNEGLIVCR
jgi:DNA-binding transcriptional LysR family regulator